MPATLADLAPYTLAERLAAGRLAWRLGAVNVRLRSPLAALGEDLREVYGSHPLVSVDQTCIDVSAVLDRPIAPMARLRRQVVFESEGEAPFAPSSVHDAQALLEWGLNWCVARNANWYLMIHAASLHRDGSALILPGPPGTGKSTLCAALIHAGWELLSDEFALISLEDGLLYPLWKPISLKNAALDLFRAREGVHLTRKVFHSHKGRVGFWPLAFGPGGYTRKAALPAWIVQLEYRPGAALQSAAATKSETFLALARNSFNYASLGHSGFESLFGLVETCECFDFRYSDLESAVSFFQTLAAPQVDPRPQTNSGMTVRR